MSASAVTLAHVHSTAESPSSRELYLAGSGSFAAEVAEWAGDGGWEVLGLIELRDLARVGELVEERPVIAPGSPPRGAAAVVAAGGSRRSHWAGLEPHGWQARTIVHPHAWVSASAELGAGCVVGPGAVIGARSVIGEHTLISRGALVGHHARIGAYVSLLPGVNLASHVQMGADAVVGMGAVVVDHTTIGADAIVAAGAVVLREVATGARVQGVPARRYAA